MSTDQLLFRIREGLITGQEKIRRYPEGPWIVVSREPLFYDELLKVLEKTQITPSQETEDKKKSEPSERAHSNTEGPPNDPDSTQIRPGPPQSKPPESKESVHSNKPADPTRNSDLKFVNSFSGELPEGFENKTRKDQPLDFSKISQESLLMRKADRSNPQESNPEGTRSTQRLPTKVTDFTNPLPSTNIVRSSELKSAQGKKNKGLSFLALGLVAASMALAVVYIFTDEKTESIDEAFGLMGPKSSVKTSLKESEQMNHEREIFKLLFTDTIENYFKAQVLSTRLIEGAPNLSDPRGLLCISHAHLWPFVNQNSGDYEIVQAARRSARMVDAKGLDGLHCEVSYLMMMGKYNEALGVIDHAANSRELPESPVLYSMKAEILAAGKKFQDAALWAAQAQKLWPDWLFPYYQQATYLEETGQYESAAQMFQNILTRNPQHRASLVELGYLQAMYLQKNDQAIANLSKAVGMPGRILKSIEAKGNFILARELSQKNDLIKAKLFAERAFQMNSSDLKIRDLLIKLGGNPNAIIANRKANEIVFVGDQYFRAGDYLFAQAQYKTAFEQDPSNALAASKAARSLWLLSQSQEAIAWTQKAIKADPKLSLPYYQAADYMSQQFNFQGAAEVLASGIQRLPNSAEILRGFGLVEIRRNNPRDAIAFLERAFKIFDNDEDTLVLLAQAYAMSGTGEDVQKASTMATRALQLEDTNPEAQVIFARTLAMLKGVDAGVDYMKELVAKYAYTPEFRRGLATLYASADRFEQAQIEYERLALMEPNDKKTMMGLAECFQAQGQLDKALKKFLAAGALDPSDPEPLIKSGLVYLEAGRQNEAINHFQRGLAVSPSFPKANYYIGRAYLEKKDFKSALAAAAAEKKINPQMADPYILSGEIYLQARDYTHCSTEYQQAVKFRPKGAENYVKLALCQELSGNIEIAESMLIIALNQESGYAEIYKVQGNISEHKGDTQAAIQAYQKYLVLAPNAADHKDIEGRLARLGSPVAQ